MPHKRLTLRDFIGVVGESVIYTAAVDIEIFTEVLHADTRALNVPAGVTYAPRAIPFKLLIVKLGLCKPKHEICLVSLVGVLFNALADTHLKVLLLKVVEYVILLEL